MDGRSSGNKFLQPRCQKFKRQFRSESEEIRLEVLWIVKATLWKNKFAYLPDRYKFEIRWQVAP